MPELPEVETIRRDMHRGILNKTIRRIDVLDARVVRMDAALFARRLQGNRIVAVERRGKALVIKLSSGEYLVVQVMMTGQMVLDRAADIHTRVRFEFTDGKMLLYNDQRTFGRLQVVASPDEVAHLRILGPEPLEAGFTDAYIAELLRRTTRPVKNVLMDHTFVAGIGNIYASEVLFRCGIDPRHRANRITRAQVGLLRRQTISVLKQAITRRGCSMNNYVDGYGNKGTFNKFLRVYARDEEPCASCATPVRRIVQAGRSTFFCPRCQR